MSPREIMNEMEIQESAVDQAAERMPEIPGMDAEDEFTFHEEKKSKNDAGIDSEYADAFPDWDLLPPKVEIRRVSHKQS